MEKISTNIAMSCEDCQLAIIAGTDGLDPQVQEHLKNCPDCREFASFQQEILAAEPVVNGKIPEFSAIRNAAAQRKASHSRFIRLVAVPFAMAAALTLVLGGVFFHNQLEESGKLVYRSKKPMEKHRAVQTASRSLNDYYMMLDDSSSFAEMLEESTVTMAWDQTSVREVQCLNSMQAARSGDVWNIEMFNPYSEE
jgi:hypothetical protein